MATIQMDLRGLKCPIPTLKMTEKLIKKEVKPGDMLEVMADCPTFEKDTRDWCKNFKKVLVVLKDQGGAKVAQIQI